MRVVRSIAISQIDHGKLPMGKKVLSFALDMLVGDVFPPIHVESRSDGRFKLKGGRHRLAAHKLRGKLEIRAAFHVKE